MGFPRKLLSDDEQVELELHPHGKALVLPVLALLVVVPLAAFLAARVPAGTSQQPVRWTVAALAVVVVAVLTGRPFLRWVTTHYVVTDRRLITRAGVLTRTGRDMPLTRINDVAFSHGLLDRLLGCGTLLVESAGERGQLVLADVPRVEQVQRRLHELAAAAEDRADPDDELDDA